MDAWNLQFSINWCPTAFSRLHPALEQALVVCVCVCVCARWHSAGRRAAVFIFSAFFNLNVSVCLLSSLLWAFKHYRSVLWKSHISINSGVALLPVSSMGAFVSKGSFVDKNVRAAFLHIQREQSTNQARGDNTCNYVCSRRFMKGWLACLHTHTHTPLYIIFDHTGTAETKYFFLPRIRFFSSVVCACFAIKDYYFSAGGITSLMVVDPWRILLTLVMSGLITCHPAKQKRIDLEEGVGVCNEGPNNLLLKPIEYKTGLNVLISPSPVANLGWQTEINISRNNTFAFWARCVRVQMVLLCDAAAIDCVGDGAWLSLLLCRSDVEYCGFAIFAIH